MAPRRRSSAIIPQGQKESKWPVRALDKFGIHGIFITPILAETPIAMMDIPIMGRVVASARYYYWFYFFGPAERGSALAGSEALTGH